MAQTKKTQQTKAQLAHKKIRRMILEGDFSTPRKWSLRKIATLLNMSVVPVSEAIRRLEQEGLLETKPQSGIQLRQLSEREVHEIMLLRQAIEVQAARLVARDKSQKLDKLEKLALKLRTLLEKHNAKQAASVDFELHLELVRLAGSEVLTKKFMETAHSLVTTKVWEDSWIDMERSGKTSHMRLVTALASGDPNKAERAIRQHIRAEKFFK